METRIKFHSKTDLHPLLFLLSNNISKSETITQCNKGFRAVTSLSLVFSGDFVLKMYQPQKPCHMQIPEGSVLVSPRRAMGTCPPGFSAAIEPWESCSAHFILGSDLQIQAKRFLWCWPSMRCTVGAGVRGPPLCGSCSVQERYRVGAVGQRRLLARLQNTQKPHHRVSSSWVSCSEPDTEEIPHSPIPNTCGAPVQNPGNNCRKPRPEMPPSGGTHRNSRPSFPPN